MGCYTYLALVTPGEQYETLNRPSLEEGETEYDLEIKGYSIPATLLAGDAAERYDSTDDYEVRYRYDVEALLANAEAAALAYTGDSLHITLDEAREKIARFIEVAERVQDMYGDRAVIVVNV